MWKTLGEAVVDRANKVSGLVVPALTAQQVGEADPRALVEHVFATMEMPARARRAPISIVAACVSP